MLAFLDFDEWEYEKISYFCLLIKAQLGVQRQIKEYEICFGT